MATINSNTQLALINASNPGTINLPSASLGQLLTFKDSLGSIGTNNITLVCATFDTFEDGASSKVLKEVRGNIQIVGSGTKWYVLCGTQVNTLNVSSITSIGVSSFSISTSALYLSSLSLIDSTSTNTLNISTFLNYNNYIVGGTRLGYNGFVKPLSYGLYYMNYPLKYSGCQLWFDASDISTITFSAGTTVSAWADKSGKSHNWTSGYLVYSAPTYSSSGKSITYGQNQGLGSTPGFIMGTTNTITVFIIGNILGLTANISLLTATVYTSFDIVCAASPKGQWNQYGGNSPTSGSTNPFTFSGSTFLVTLIYDGTNTTGYYNGSVVVGPGASGTAGFTTSQQWGQQVNNVSGTIFSSNEVVVYNVGLTTDQRQQIEGYLAWKWTIQTSLPSTHPYAYIPPPV